MFILVQITGKKVQNKAPDFVLMLWPYDGLFCCGNEIFIFIQIDIIFKFIMLSAV